MGLLRIIGMNKNEINYIVIKESMLYSAASLILACIMVHIEVEACISNLTVSLEIPRTYAVNLTQMILLCFFLLFIVYIATFITTRSINSKSILQIINN